MDQKLREETIAKVKKQIALVGTTIGGMVDAEEDNPLVGLTEKELGFVEAYAALAGSHGAQTNAARYAGYAEKTCAYQGTMLLRKPKILKALRYLTEHKAHASAILAMRTLEDLMTSGTDAIRMKAAEKVLGYAGIIVKTIHKHEHEIQDNRTPDQVKKAIEEKAQKLGIPLGGLVDVTPKTNNPNGAPKYKKVLIPGRQLSDEEVDGIDWLNAKVNVD